jgi:hypothetical protein
MVDAFLGLFFLVEICQYEHIRIAGLVPISQRPMSWNSLVSSFIYTSMLLFQQQILPWLRISLLLLSCEQSGQNIYHSLRIGCRVLTADD